MVQRTRTVRVLRSRASLVVIGLGLCFTALAVLSLGQIQAETRAKEVASNGVDLVDRARLAVSEAMDRTRSVSAFLSSSELVTKAEFERFARITGPGEAISGIGLRSVEGLQGRLDYSYTEGGMVENDVLDQIDLEATVAKLAWVRQPVSEGLLDGTAMVLVVGPVMSGEDGGVITGVVYALVDLGDLGPPSGSDTDFSFREATRHDIASGVASTRAAWRTIDSVAGRLWTFELKLTEQTPIDRSLVVVTVFGLVGSFLAAAFVGLRAEQSATELAFEDLRQTTADKDRFMASVAHELRTPLTSVVGLASVLESSWTQMEADDVQQILSDVHHEGRELADLVEDLLTIGRVESGVLTFVSTDIDLTEEVRGVVGRMLIPGHLTVDFGPRSELAHADGLRTRQIFRNLLSNAVRHAATKIWVTPFDTGDSVGVAIANDGFGIPPEQVSKLFGAYNTGLRVGQPGSIGLGLYVSRQLARGMGGDLCFVQHPDSVVFELILPKVDGFDPSPPGVGTSSQAGHSRI